MYFLLQCNLHICYSNEAHGWTALSTAASEGHDMIVEFLIKHGADINGKFLDGQKLGWNVSVYYMNEYMYMCICIKQYIGIVK